MSLLEKVLISNKVLELSEKTKKTYREYIKVYTDYCDRNNLMCFSFKSATLYLDYMKTSYKSLTYINSLKFLLAKCLDVSVSSFPKYKFDKKNIKKINRHFSEMEFKKICIWAKENLEFDLLAKFLIAMIVTGLRVSEVSRFTLKNFKELLENKVTEVIVKGNFFKKVYLPEDFVNYFEIIVNMYGHLPDEFYVFCLSRNYTTNVVKLFRYRFYKLLAFLDIEKSSRSFHSIRRAFANIYLKATNYDFSFIQVLLGHSSLKTTFKYLGLTDEDVLYRQNKCGTQIIEQIFKN